MRSFLLFCVVFLLREAECYTPSSSETKCNGQNEVLSCVKRCPPERTCKTRDIQVYCMPEDGCKNKCVCKEGYYRNPLRECISNARCDQCSGINEYYTCGGVCDNVCATLHEMNQTSCPWVNIKCNDMCYCEAGHARNDRNECVPFYKCPPQIKERNRRYTSGNPENQCGANEEWKTCKKSCPPEVCMSIIARYKCDSKEPCRQECGCKPGFLRRGGGTPCIPIKECPEMANLPEYQQQRKIY